MGIAHAHIGTAISLGAKAPDAELRDEQGTTVFLSSFWDEQPLVAVFLEGLSSGPATDHLIALRDAAGEFDQAGARVAVVLPTAPGELAAFKAKLNVPHALLSDPRGGAHHAYDATDGISSFVIDTGGVVRYAHCADNVLKAPSMFDLIDAVCGLTGEVVARPEVPVTPIPIGLHGTAVERPAIAGTATNPVDRATYACAKCGGSGYETVQIATSGGWLSRLFNFQYRKFVAVVCTTCNYAELYRTKGGAAANIADILIGS